MIDWLLCAFVKAIGWLFCRLPPAVCVRLGQAVGWPAFWLQPKRVRIAQMNLKAAFGARFTPAQRRRIIRGIFEELVVGVVEMLRLPVIDQAYVDRYIEIVGRKHFEAAVASGSPVIILTGHCGNWELSSIAAALKGYPAVALAREQAHFPKLYRLLVSYRESKGCRIVHKGGAMRQLVKALEERHIVGIVGDQASRQGIPVTFFGRTALFATGPFELARRSGALIVPIFMHRKQGPFHRLIIEPPIRFPKRGTPEAMVRAGIEQFVALLTQHIEQTPAQWLWLHKRWKHTPDRRVLVLSDGKLGHLKQSMIVLQAFKEQAKTAQEQVIDVRYRHRLGRALLATWAWLIPRGWGALGALRLGLELSCFHQLASASADLIVSCGSSVAPVTVLLTSQNLAKSVVIMNPAPIPLRKFSLAFVPVHDRVARRPNVVETVGALTGVNDGQIREARERLRAHPRFRLPGDREDGRPNIVLLLGGDTDEYRLTTGFVETLVRHILTVCEDLNGCCLVTTSRRTPSEVERVLVERLANHPRCRLLLLASRDQLNGTLEGMLGWAQVVVVTGESISMISEACASGRYVVVVEPPLRYTESWQATKPQRYIRFLSDQHYIRNHPMPEVGHAIRQVLTRRPPVRRLETYQTVQAAVKRLL